MATSFRRRFRIYLDTCCIGRLFDDQTQERVRLEAETILAVLKKAESGTWSIVTSEVLEMETDSHPDKEKRERTQTILSLADSRILLDDAVVLRSEELVNLNFSPWDAMHIACAERARVDVLLTVDGDMLRKARKHATLIKVAVRHPMEWMPEALP